MKTNNELLGIALSHEYHRCKTAFNLFGELVKRKDFNSTKEIRIDCYNSYVDFIAHLYEFYIGLITQDDKFKQKGLYTEYPSFKNKETHEILDIIFNEEVAKFCRNRKDRLRRGIKDPLTRDGEIYEENIPPKFGEHFRYMRNRRNHVDFRRTSSEYDISIAEFFKRYHIYTLILFYECTFPWNISGENFNCSEIDDFVNEIFK